MKGDGRPTRLLPYAKMLLVRITFFSLLPGRLCSGRFWLSRLFHIEKSWHTYRFTVVCVSGRQDLPSDVRAYSLNSLSSLTNQAKIDDFHIFINISAGIYSSVLSNNYNNNNNNIIMEFI